MTKQHLLGVVSHLLKEGLKGLLMKLEGKVKSMKKIRAIIILAFLLLIIVGGYMFSSQYKWSSELNVAINQGDVNRIKELLKDDSKDVNFAGKSVRNFGRERPLEFACYCEKVDYRVVELLVKRGAKAYPGDYENAIHYYDEYMYENVKLLLSTGTKPVIAGSCANILGTIASTYTTIGEDIYGIKRLEWEKKITETYKLIYYNAKPFDKKAELFESLDFAKEAENETLIAFIESELNCLEKSKADK